MEHISKKYEASYVFTAPINRLTQLLNNSKHINELNSRTQLPYLFTDKPIPLTFAISLIEITSIEYSNRFSWLLSSPNIPSPVYYNFNLVSNTLDDTTFVVFEMIFESPEKIAKENGQKINNGCNQICHEVMNGIETMLQINHNTIYQFESNVIKAPREKIWNHFISLDFLKNEYIEDIQLTGKADEVGTELNWVFKKDKVKCSCKIAKISNLKRKKKWTYKLSACEGLLKSQEVAFSMVEISENETFVSFTHRFNEQVSADALQHLEKRKKTILILMKVLFECDISKVKEMEKELMILTNDNCVNGQCNDINNSPGDVNK